MLECAALPRAGPAMIDTMRQLLAWRRTRRMVESMTAQPCESGVRRPGSARSSASSRGAGRSEGARALCS